MSSDWFKDIHEMNEHYGFPSLVADFPQEKLHKLLTFRESFLNEENREFSDGIRDKCSEEVVDALIDICVVAIGTLDLFGVDGQKAWDTVLKANMSKEVGIKASRPNPLGLPDLIKPSGWVAPDHKGNTGKIGDCWPKPREVEPVNRENVVLTTGEPVPEDRSHTEPQPGGQQKAYVVLTESERGKGFVRTVRDAYKHVGMPGPRHPLRDLTEEEHRRYDQFGYVKYEKYPDDSGPTGKFWTQKELDSIGNGCGRVTTMSRSLSETYARDPEFYGATFCSHCGTHLRAGKLGEFVWIENDGSIGPRVGT
jgi:Phosphoribosyl-ATP pyrophosphohydrolase